MRGRSGEGVSGMPGGLEAISGGGLGRGEVLGVTTAAPGEDVRRNEEWPPRDVFRSGRRTGTRGQRAGVCGEGCWDTRGSPGKAVERRGLLSGEAFRAVGGSPKSFRGSPG